MWNHISPEDLAESDRKRGLYAMFMSTFLGWGGFFMIIPLMTVHYVDDLAWAAGSLGMILAIRQFVQQGLSPLFGALADRVGPKPLLIIGGLVRSVGFASLAFGDTFWQVLPAALAASLGGAMFEAPSSATMAALAPDDQRTRIFSTNGVISSIGTTVGTQVGALLIGQSFDAVCVVAGLMYVINATILAFALPPIAIASAHEGGMANIGRVIRDVTFVRYVVLLTGYWFAWVQFALTITLAATRLADTDRAVSWIYLVNFGVTICLGYVLPRLLERWLRPLYLVVIGCLVMALGLLAVGAATSVPAILAAAGLFTLGAVIARPGHETVTAGLALPHYRGAYFGVAFLALAVGGGLGNYLGGTIYDAGSSSSRMLPWLVYAAIVSCTAVGVWLERNRLITRLEA